MASYQYALQGVEKTYPHLGLGETCSSRRSTAEDPREGVTRASDASSKGRA